jgi:hypothetical protein
MHHEIPLETRTEYSW